MTRKCLGILSAALLVLSLATTNARAQGPREGIKVHGHWMFEVFNPDGSLAERREVENALQPGGQEGLAYLLFGLHSISEWSIVLRADKVLFSGPNNSTASEFAQIAKRRFLSDGSAVPFLNLTTLANRSPSSLAYDQFVLKGTATVAAAGQILSVQTTFMSCPYNFTADLCASRTISAAEEQVFSGTVLAQPITLVPDQSVHVTVTISFS